MNSFTPKPWVAPQALLPRCACCGDVSDRFDPLILEDDGIGVCGGCVPSYIEGQLSVRVLDASNIGEFWDRLCAGAPPIERRPVRSGNKAKDLAGAFAEIDAAFAPKVGLYDLEDGEPSCASFEVRS